MSNVSSIAASGLAAAALRLEVSASNVANAQSTEPVVSAAGRALASRPTVAKHVAQTARPDGGTRATVTRLPASYSPGAFTGAAADGTNPVASTNVDLANEIVQMIMARYGFAANAQVMKADARVMAAFLDITA